MMKKNIIGKVVLGSIIAILVIVVVVLGIFSYKKLNRILRLADFGKKIYTETFEYSAEYDIDQVYLNGEYYSFHGNVKGDKGDHIIFGEVTVDDKKVLDVYFDKDQTIAFNLKPLVDAKIQELGRKIYVPTGSLSNLYDEIYVSLEQIEEITGTKYLDKENQSNWDKMRLFEKISSLINAYDIKTLTQNEKMRLPVAFGKQGLNYKLIDKSNNAEIIIVLPKNKNDQRCYLEYNLNGMHLQMSMNYDITEVAQREMPKEYISEEVVDLLKFLYQMIN